MDEVRKITPEEWRQFPAKPAKAPDQWAPILDGLERGDIYTLAYTDVKDLRGKRISLARRAAQRGFKLETRTRENLLAVRRSDLAYRSPGQERKARGTRRKTGTAPEQSGPGEVEDVDVAGSAGESTTHA